jgi:UDP:flavonoid glycosyltransferase YjiC (YdhE family)
MTTLLISPDYLSHYAPLSVVGRALSAAGDRVVVATGAALRGRVIEDGFGWRELRLGPSSNPGLIADPAIDAFVAATERGPAATIAHQARERLRDLLWQPERVAADIERLLDRLDPERVVVDHVSFGSTLALHASGRPFTTLVPGHPTQLPVGPERYGLPPRWPRGMHPDPAELAELEALLDRVAEAFTERWNRALAGIDPQLVAVTDAHRVHGHRVCYNAVAELQDPARAPLLPADHRFLGPLVRPSTPSSTGARWDDGPADRPRVLVALGTFLGHRGDVLARLAEGLHRLGVRAAIATGPTPPGRLGPVPDDWIVAPTLPQVELLAGADVAVHHGGNNSVQEALAAGCRQIVLPFSTDQFANAADLACRAGATVLPPNEASAADLATAVDAALGSSRPAPVPVPSPAQLVGALGP